ncbi:transcriptional regulator AraC family [Cupriavidus necator N-1]|uniref:Transcriptional regulator AraC family n=1 Tax=Cupriavidus necator (strain ATCC 43291 / DSM 13513 / CCUG 52238 / LMG 8453 / N-1) TaxID=1042878 RepID=F8GTK9_CUPNN|nr:AraC family transcriptional regulator [Cupriavidus necator]AEI79966.1 transcriptional regulator AraC family [Cupriavidus necator N-1]MDX6010403.1 AraC family transcriptional regulator [Cupriavidus necator]
MSSLVRAAALTNYSEVARTAGLDPVRMLLDAGLSPSVLREPDLMIPVERVGRLLQASATLSGNESFGLCMAESRLLSNLGAVGLLIRDQATLRDSLRMLMRYQAWLNGALSLAVEECGELVIIREAVIAGSAHQPTRQRVELALGVMVRLIRQLLKPDWEPRRVCFEHPAPRDLSTHHRFFGPCVEFDYEFNCIICAKADLDARNPSADPAMARYAQQLIDASVISQQATMFEDVRRIVLLLLPSGRCSIEQVADHLGVVCRTVQRRLAEEGQSFSSIVNDIRTELAARHVVESDRPLTEVATLLGFSAPSGFSRWYHAQFGCSPKESRATRGTVRRKTTA